VWEKNGHHRRKKTTKIRSGEKRNDRLCGGTSLACSPKVTEKGSKGLTIKRNFGRDDRERNEDRAKG